MGFGGPPATGSDGNFTANAYAARGAQMTHPIVSNLVEMQVAERYENDPFYDAFSYAADMEMRRRLEVA